MGSDNMNLEQYEVGTVAPGRHQRRPPARLPITMGIKKGLSPSLEILFRKKIRKRQTGAKTPLCCLPPELHAHQNREKGRERKR